MLKLLHFTAEHARFQRQISELWQNVIKCAATPAIPSSSFSSPSSSSSSSSSSHDSWRSRVALKLAELYDYFRDEPLMVPLDDIVEVLENINCQRNFNAWTKNTEQRKWVVNALLSAKVPAARLLDVYHNKVDTFYEEGSSEKKHFGMLWSTYFLLDLVLDRRTGNAREATVAARDTYYQCHRFLRERAENTGPMMKELNEMFTNLGGRLETRKTIVF
mmetsp:Transcript_36877/g.72409  ORF Transcript_36877/g.72409 Transcript_36877/m.72409 type:complete len:218 (+) Transcript_36877:254-907(+)